MSKPQQTQAGGHQFSFTSIDGEPMSLADFKGQVVMVVNTASQCGFTKQYKDLQALYETYKDRGFSIIGVPCNNFGGQEPGAEETIKDFARNKFGVTFPLTAKADVNGANAHPFFTWASSQKKGGVIFSTPRWNFHKFLLDQNGQLVKSFGSQTGPLSRSITSEIDKLLAMQSH